MSRVLKISLMVWFLPFLGIADEEAPLDPGPKVVRPVKEIPAFRRFEPFRWDLRRTENDLSEVIARQTDVKSQGRRGTCSIFSATGMVESLYKISLNEDPDLSENYLEYLVMSKMKAVASEGSDTPLNIPAIKRYGTLFESDWPYEEYDWTNSGLPEFENEKAQTVCGHLFGNKKQACLLSHMDPDNDLHQEKAQEFYNTYKTQRLEYDYLDEESEIKRHLNRNHPLILSVEFFYGAWNHRKMEEYSIGQRDMVLWAKGMVSTPTPKDINLSRKHPAGHSFVIVGYDDNKQVYFFKNSWGLGSFGVSSDLLGPATTNGYGSITYGYAHRFGTFYLVNLQRN